MESDQNNNSHSLRMKSDQSVLNLCNDLEKSNKHGKDGQLIKKGDKNGLNEDLYGSELQ